MKLREPRKESGNSSSTLTGRVNKQFATDTAEKTGVTRQKINRAVSRAEGVTEEFRGAVRGRDLRRIRKNIYLSILLGFRARIQLL